MCVDISMRDDGCPDLEIIVSGVIRLTLLARTNKIVAEAMDEFRRTEDGSILARALISELSPEEISDPEIQAEIQAFERRKPKHPIYIGQDLKVLAESIGNMRYDKTAEFIGYLCDDLHRQAENDCVKGRKQLANLLEEAATHLLAAQDSMNKVWKLCEPYM